jgi:hypothetical protein
MLIATETGEKLGIFHVSKVLQTRYCQHEPASDALRLRLPQQNQVADYLVSQVCMALLEQRYMSSKLIC